MAKQVKSKQRVSEHGEVFTNEREVNAILDMVKQETERIDSRFLEPACGNGNFLAEVLQRKLEVVKSRYGKSLSDYEKYVFVAVGSIYGVELLPDNAQECRERLLNIVKDAYAKQVNKASNPRFLQTVEYVIGRNILCGDALNLRDAAGNPIIFSEWSLATGQKVKRRDFRLDELLDGNVGRGDTLSLFGEIDESGDFNSRADWEYDEETKTYIPLPIKEYPLIDVNEVASYE